MSFNIITEEMDDEKPSFCCESEASPLTKGVRGNTNCGFDACTGLTNSRHDCATTLRLNQEEFVEGLLSLCLLDMPISAIQTLKLLQMILSLSKKINQNVEAQNEAELPGMI